ncbi:MAG: hypothetical protein NTW49_02130 [Bacteroidia bacterium]|nr:hypothetical protein [Bacteroidia bacterium]
MKISAVILSFIGASFMTGVLQAQIIPDQITAGDALVLNIPQVSLISTNNAPVSMTLTTSTAGSSITVSATNDNLWVKVTSVVPSGSHRDIKAKIVGAVPRGTKLTLQPLPATRTNSGGNLGTPVSSPVVLSAVDQNIISDIRSCYTGTGPNDGYQMVYTWSLVNPSVNFGLIEANEGIVVTVYLTLTQASGD